MYLCGLCERMLHLNWFGMEIYEYSPGLVRIKWIKTHCTLADMLFCVPHSYDCIDKRIVAMEKRNINRLKNSLKKIKWICCSANTHHTGYICVCLLERKTVAQCCHILFILSINAHRCWKMWRIYPLNIPILVFVLSLFLSTSRSRLALTLSHSLSLSFACLLFFALLSVYMTTMHTTWYVRLTLNYKTKQFYIHFCVCSSFFVLW